MALQDCCSTGSCKLCLCRGDTLQRDDGPPDDIEEVAGNRVISVRSAREEQMKR